MARPAQLLTIVLVFVGCSSFERYHPSESSEPVAEIGADGPFVGVGAFERARADAAVVLDARGSGEFAAGHIPGAVHTPWTDFVDGSKTGLLSDDLDRLQARLRDAGLRADTEVFVYGAWNDAWGEEGRIFWMLEYFGHEHVRVLQGGVQAWQAAGHQLTDGVSSPVRGDFSIRVRPELRATADEVQAATEDGGAVILDIREPEEYDGATPYGAPRGGHVPTAVPFPWRGVFDADGRLKDPEVLHGTLRDLGIERDTVVLAYCTGGIRSGFMYTVLRWAGYEHPRNYDGSWWEWSSDDERPVEP